MPSSEMSISLQLPAASSSKPPNAKSRRAKTKRTGKRSTSTPAAALTVPMVGRRSPSSSRLPPSTRPPTAWEVSSVARTLRPRPRPATRARTRRLRTRLSRVSVATVPRAQAPPPHPARPAPPVGAAAAAAVQSPVAPSLSPPSTNPTPSPPPSTQRRACPRRTSPEAHRHIATSAATHPPSSQATTSSRIRTRP